MVFVVDDLLTFPLSFAGVEMLPNYFTMMFNAVCNYALDQIIGEIQDKIKENRMEFELGEVDKKQSDFMHRMLIKHLRNAELEKREVLGASVKVVGA